MAVITEQDLNAAIAECEGKRDPKSNDCIKLAAFYIIKNELYGKSEQLTGIPEQLQNSQQLPAYSTLPPVQTIEPPTIQIDSDTEFARAVNGRGMAEIMPIIDELMLTLQVLEPRLYLGVMRRIDE